VRFGFWVIAGLAVLLDQWSKHLVLQHLAVGETRPFLPGVLALTHVHNTGVAFGQLRGAGPVLILGALIAAAAILIYRASLLRRGEPLHPVLVIGLALPLGGALGNMIDRIRLGQVVDFLEFQFVQFPVFNVADVAITAGAGLLLLYFGVLHRHPEEHPAPASAAPEMAEVRD
jgi:signal peptidase II